MRPMRLDRHRRNAESQMIDSCTVTREDPDAPIDEVTGVRPRVQVYPDPTWPDEHRLHRGPAKSQSYEGYESTPEAGGHEYTVQRYAAHFPWDAFTPQTGDVVTWTACPQSPSREGTQDRITAPFDKSMYTAIRVAVDRIAL